LEKEKLNRTKNKIKKMESASVEKEIDEKSDD
jgi:hypothetical protein